MDRFNKGDPPANASLDTKTPKGDKSKRRVLFVCTANQHRSRTAEDLYRRDPRYDVRSAGTDVSEGELDEQPLTEELLVWADIIFVMEPYHREVIEERYPWVEKKIVVLDIDDIYNRGDALLIMQLRIRLSRHLA